MKFQSTRIPGCRFTLLDLRSDARGTFCKTMHETELAATGLPTIYREQYYSVSKLGVIRGMHFQLPPHDHAKMVFCASGRIHDVVLDLRTGSPTYGVAQAFELDGMQPGMLHIPRGCAHGFCALSEGAITFYTVETVYAQAFDAGVRWDSFGHDWPIKSPVMSERDMNFPSLAEFVSPFRWRGEDDIN